ncbi:MAG TPA: quinoprotein relay system zinc metallohydrolase 2 [Dokdonella sp.]
MSAAAPGRRGVHGARRGRGRLAFAAFAALALRAAAAADAFAIDEIAAGVFVHPGRPVALDAPGHDDIANIGFVVGTRCVAVVDAGGSMRIGRALRAAIRARTPTPICYVLDTHDHVDHVLGDAAFRDDRPSFVGHANLAAALARDRALFLREYAGDLDAPASAAEIVAPDRGVAVGRDAVLDLGGRRLVLRAWPKAHTDSDLTVYDERSGTLWTGDLVFRARLPALDGSVVGWLAALDALARQPARRVVPGHGPLARDLAAAIAPERRYLEALRDGVRAAIARGEPMQQAIEQVGRDERARGWLLWEPTHAHNVARAYQELEWE